ncbi:MAG: hypothetical protein A3F31_04100 [Candidatus Levybacteria bacterium RIFCSPHIGHO2_12_FULL_38_12]|nr:MAG: hypothetical protein A3F31_04100 [Candidatus Levybacteria bacterium RIFCSPHIGHO2_12_FULL_38_12]OGH34380.1 MAG: hypothetical protein A3A47_04495 [Candidatus Levybacteria bacterium RIFCSPLOWO2_01_FULL_37_20]OGH44435.1 MAG: hypothetical protein A3J14_03215 [Candidatus Levybacteria bacterium RIFCSPLOWO2_02_FULL_37_18]
MKCDISFIIPVLNEEEKIGKLLNKIHQASSDYNTEIIVIDSGSTDSTAKIVKLYQRKISNLHLISKNKTDFNRSKTRNLAIRKAKSKLICLCTGHAIPTNNNFIKYFLDDFKLNNKVVAVFTEDILSQYTPIIPRIEVMCKMERLNKYCNRNGVLLQTLKAPFIDYNENNKFLWYFMSNIFTCYKKSFLLKYPFPNTEYGEDALLGKILIEKGYAKVYDRRCATIHYHKFSLLQYYQREKEDLKLRISKLKVKNRVNISAKIAKLLNMRVNPIQKIYFLLQLLFYYSLKLFIFASLFIKK